MRKEEDDDDEAKESEVCPGEVARLQTARSNGFCRAQLSSTVQTRYKRAESLAKLIKTVMIERGACFVCWERIACGREACSKNLLKLVEKSDTRRKYI